MPKIILIRPGETQEEKDGFLIGRFDADLNERGRQQALQVSSYLGNRKITRVVVSPLKRALSMAMALCEKHDRIPRLVKSFDGVDLGDWENQRTDDLMARDGLRFQKWIQEPDFPCPGGESLRNVYRRSFSELAKIVQQCEPGEHVAVIAPSAVLRCLCCGILDIDLKTAVHFSLDHGGVCVFARDLPGYIYQLQCWNDTQHLQSKENRTLELESEI